MNINNYIDTTELELQKLNDFYELHLKAPLNLTAIKNRNDFFIKHYLDSIYIFRLKKFKFNSLLDVGTGGGFPGVVVAIFYPEKNITLLESKRKKCDFLENAVEKLNLQNIKIINDRVENVKKIKFDIITARGVGKTLELLKKTKNVSRETSIRLFYKGEKIKDELVEAKSYLKKNKLKVENVRIETPFKRTYCIIGSNTD
jgi:16S rRNA (guanine527-N7)-methyltransferase